MKKTITLLLLTLFVSSVSAQVIKKEGVIKKLADGVTIEIDGVLDAAYDDANVYDVDRPYGTETPSVGATGETHWQALWNMDGIFIFVTVNDNVWFPKYMDAGTSGDGFEEWRYDKIELYFDANYDKADAAGPGTANSGHYQIAPQPDEALIGGEPTTWDTGVIWAYNVANPAYTLEVFVPWSFLKDKTGKQFLKNDELGFDVNVTDRDAMEPGRMRMLWSNNADPENWGNMDDAGIVTFDDVPDVTYITSLTLNADPITMDNETRQIEVVIEPEDATIKDLNWTVRSGRARVSSTGLVTPILDGDVVIRGEAIDGSGVRTDITINVSNQIATMKELSLILNGDFRLVNEDNSPTHWSGWIADAAIGGPTSVQDGVAVLPVIATHITDGNVQQWGYQFNQTGFKATPDVPYILSFDAWSDVERVATVDFEDIEGNGYARYGKSETGVNGESEWTFNLTTEKQKFEFEVLFDRILPNTVEKVQFMVSQAVGTVFIDNVILISEADMLLVPSEFDVVFNVDMTDAVDFDPAADVVFITGTIFDPEWPEPGTLAAEQTLTRVGETMIWSKTLTLEPGDYAFKHFIGAGWEGGEWAGAPDRLITVDGPLTVNSLFGTDGFVSVRNPEMVNVRVYPNPARSFFTVDASSRINRVMVTDLAGKTVHSSRVNENQVRIENQFETGIYIVRVFTDDGVSVRKLQVVR